LIRTFKSTITRRPRTARGRGIVPQHAPRQLRGLGEDVTVITGPGLADAGTTVSFGGNPILMEARVALIFYGDVWNDLSMSPNCTDIQSAVATILNSSYVSMLSDYECGGAAMDLNWNWIVKNDPPNPCGDDDAADVVHSMIDDFYSTLPPFNRPNFYAVFLPPGIPMNPVARGAHTYEGSMYYSWQRYADLDNLTRTFSHELVEAMTDPDGGGWQVDPRDGPDGWNEIADVCKNSFARVNGVAVSAYFSRSLGACVVPQPDPPPPPPPALPDGEYQISCCLFESHNSIPFIAIVGGTIGGQPWWMETQHAIKRMQQGGLTFFTLADGKRAEVLIGHSLAFPFLTTAADNTLNNNLDVIANNNPCQIPADFILWQ
jgi:hypothetical protein